MLAIQGAETAIPVGQPHTVRAGIFLSEHLWNTEVLLTDQAFTLTGVKPGMSRDSRVSHTEWTRGWLAEASASASPTALRCAGVMKASPAALADWASSAPVKAPEPGVGQPLGSIGHPETRSAGRKGHRRSASIKSYKQG